MKLSQILAFRDALVSIQMLPLPAPFPWAVRRNMQKIEPVVKAFEEEYVALVAKHAAPDQPAWMPNTPLPKFADQTAADADWRALLDTEEEMSPYMVDEAVIEKTDGLSAAVIDALAPMIRLS